jgi:hypothetical protein
MILPVEELNDLKTLRSFSSFLPCGSALGHESGTLFVLAAHGVSAALRTDQVHQALRRQPTRASLFRHDQLLCMAFAHLTFRDSLRDTVLSLRASGTTLYHLGIRGRVCKSTLADANERRDWRIWADLAQVLIAQARVLYAGQPMGVRLRRTVSHWIRAPSNCA